MAGFGRELLASALAYFLSGGGQFVDEVLVRMFALPTLR